MKSKVPVNENENVNENEERETGTRPTGATGTPRGFDRFWLYIRAGSENRTP